jgi:hypothetical protein
MQNQLHGDPHILIVILIERRCQDGEEYFQIHGSRTGIVQMG